MRRAVFVLLVLALAAIAVALRHDLGGRPRPATPPSAAGSTAGAPSAAAPPAAIAPTPADQPGSPGRADAAALARARDVLAAIEARGGEPPPGYVGGRGFQNRERRLPAGRYREYDLHPRVVGRDRGPERLVVDQTTGRAYYTGDHYQTFVPVN